MANYNSIEEIIASGIENMQVLVNNTAYDDNSFTADGADWLKYNGAVATKIYANGNSWFGIGTTSEHLRVNRRDAKMWYLYREEGTLYRYYKFLKFRWRGYSQYSQTSGAYALTYDVIFWDNGCISLHMVDIPTAQYNGTFSLTAAAALTYTKPTADTPDVTFTPQDAECKTFAASYELIQLAEPYDRKYLVRSNGTLYTVADGALSEIGAVEPTAEVFRTNGVDDLPDGALLLSLTNPEVLYWHDSQDDLPELRMTVKGTPPLPQMFTSKPISMAHESIAGIDYAEIEASEDVRFAITFDGGTTWKAHNGEYWYDTSDTAPGMLASTFTAITPTQWAEVAPLGGEYRLRFWIPSVTAYVKKAVIHYINP